MSRHPRRRTILVASLGLFLVSAGAVYGASTAMSGTTIVGSNASAVTSPCTEVSPSYVPSYDAVDATYETNEITVRMTCALDTYHLSVAVAVGGEDYVEKTQTVEITSLTPTDVTVTLPAKVRASDIANIAVLVTKY